MDSEKTLRSLGSGLAGALALTLVHQTARKLTDKAPRADILGMRAIAKAIRSNTLYYSLVGAAGGASALLRGAALGLGAGLGALALPGPLGLGSRPTNRTAATQVMTVAWYLLGGLAAAGASALLARGESSA